MTTKPDFDMINELAVVYRPKTRGIVTDDEAGIIKAVLGIPHRTDVELQNVRNAVVMLYGQKADGLRNDPVEAMAVMDAMSAITAVIDTEKSKRGMPV